MNLNDIIISNRYKKGGMNVNIKKLGAYMIAATMSVLSLSGCGQAASPSPGNTNTGNSAADTIKIGGSFALTGAVSIYGIAASNGAKLAIEEYNAKGGVLGKQVQFILEDNKGEQVDAANSFRKLVDNNNVVAFIGSDISSTTETIANIAAERNIPMITPTGTRLGITAIGNNVFRACYIDPAQGALLAQFAKEDLNATNVAVMVNSEVDYSVGIAETFTEDFEAMGGKVAVTVNYGDSDIDFKPILMNVKNANPDVVVVPDYYENIALIAAQAKEIGLNVPLIGGDGWDGVTTQVANNPEVVEGNFFINHYTPEDNRALVKDFIENYTAKYNEEPNAFAALGYDAALILLEAIESAGTTDSDAVITAMANTSLECVTGQVTFNEERNPIKSVSVIRIKNGQNTLFKQLDPQ
jgi:branched-chain amino acid transport system substrate-binding protein